MTETAVPGKKPALGVGSILGEAFSILYRNFVVVFVLAFVPITLGYLVSGASIGFEVNLGIREPDFTGVEPALIHFLIVLVEVFFISVATALVVQFVRDLKLNRSVGLARYVRVTMAHLLPIAVLSAVATVLIILALMVLIVPGLWVTAVFYVVAPVIVIERAGYSALGRSARLTKGYRWPIVGLYLLFFAFALLEGFVGVFVFRMISESIGIDKATAISAAIDAVYVGLSAITVALVYARLIEIKEGMSTDQFAAVFD